MINRRSIFWFAAVFLAVLFVTAVGRGQSILLSSGNFALLAGTAITSTGSVGTMVTGGNVGSAVAITGFPPATLAAPYLLITGGGVVNQGLLDLITAENGLAGMPSNVTMGVTNLGGLNLTPAVYTFGAAAAQNGALTLDAQGKNNVFWVFQIGTSLVTSSGSSVNLINPGTNGGSDDGIFWVAETGGITIGDSSVMLGNYLAHTSITFSGTTSASGGVRALAEAGITLDRNQVNPLGGPGGSDFSGALMYNGSGQVVPKVIPEPAAFGWLAALGALGLAGYRRERRQTAANAAA